MEPNPNEKKPDQNEERKSVESPSLYTAEGEKVKTDESRENKVYAEKPSGTYFWSPLLYWFRHDCTVTDWIIAIFTIVIAVVAYAQYGEMGASGIQTDRMLHLVRSQLKEQHIVASAAHQAAVAAQIQSINTELLADRALSQAQAANKLAQQAKRSADISQASLVAQDRPWLGYDHIDVSENVAVGSTLKSHIFYKNWGRGPALRVTHTYGMQVLCVPFPKSPTYGIEMDASKAVALMPDQIAESAPTHFIEPMTELVLARIKTPGCGLYLYAKIIYADQSNRRHWRHFCSQWVIGTDNIFNACPGYNDGDEDHPDGTEP